LKVDDNDTRFLNSHIWKDENIHQRILKILKQEDKSSFAKLDLIADSLIKFDPYFRKSFSRARNYWIIKKNENIVLGPFSQQEFLDMRGRLYIPKELKFKN
jgi:hypothetical protein